MNTTTTRSFFLATTLMLGLAGSAGQAITITFSLNGYGGGNVLSSGDPFPDGTKIKLGFFYSGSSFASNSAVQSNWDNLAGGSGTLASKLDSLGSSFYTIAQTTSLTSGTEGTDDYFLAAFHILYHIDTTGAAPGALVTAGKFDTVISTPGIGIGSFDVKGKNAFVWIETADRSEFGLFYSAETFPTLADDDFSVNVLDSSTGVFAIAGSINDAGVALIPEPSTGLLFSLGLGILTLARRKQSKHIS
jgi:hypothetical protein